MGWTRFYRELDIPIRGGRGRHDAEQFSVRFCFRHAPLPTHSAIASVMNA